VADIFLSYAREDEATAQRAAKALGAAGYDVWWDAQLPAHRAYSDVIERHLKEARAVVVLWSAKAAQSQWVRAEADFARSAGKLVQGALDGAIPPLPFNQIQCADLKGWRGREKHGGWSKLKASVAALVSGEEPAVAAAPAPLRWWDVPRHRWLAAAGALVLLLAAFLVPRYLAGGDEEKPVVAVLPFESLDKRDESLVAGIWEDTRQAIGRNPQLLVLGPNTAEEIASKDGKGVAKLADYLVEASVRSAGDRIRVNANLVRTEDGAEMWSKSFDRRLDDVFALQSEIAGEIEGHIRGRLAERGGVMPQHIATSGEVYALYSDARAKIRKRQVGKYEEAYRQLEQVVKVDPNYAPGWATLAVIKKFGLVSQKTFSSGETDARKAIALAPNLAAGHAALGFVLQRGPAAQASLRRALALDPNDIEAMNWLANSMDPETQRADKIALYSRIAELEPLWWPAILNKVEMLFEDSDQTAIDREIARIEGLGDGRMAAAMKSETSRRRGDLSGAVKASLPYFRKGDRSQDDMFGMFLFQPLLQLGLFDLADQAFPPPSDWIPYLRKNDPHALDMIEAELPPKEYWTYGPLPIVAGRVYLINGMGPRLAKRYRAAASTPEEFEKLVGSDGLTQVAPIAALALRSVGDDVQARSLLALAETAAKPAGRPNPDQLVTMARIYAVQGRTDEGIGLLSEAIRANWLPPYLPIHTDIALDPPLNELRKDPRFEKLRQQILGHLRKERIELGPVTLN
jgi:adenylate cyclase